MPGAKTSAGCLLFRIRDGRVEVLLGHMGGPLWSGKDARAWSIPKGVYDASSERAFDVALREFEEELGSPPPATEFMDLGEVRQSGGKRVHVWAGEGDFDATSAVSNTFDLEWPKGSGRIGTYPEIDRAAWLAVDEARGRLIAAQAEFLDRLLSALEAAGRIAVREGP